MGDAAVSQRFEDSLGYLVNHLMYAFRHGIIRRCVEAGYAVTHEEFGVLVLLRRDDGATQTRLARSLAKDKAVITRLLNGLVKKGLVMRRSDTADRRVVRAFLTADGIRAIQCIYPVFLDYVTSALQDVNQRDFDTTREVLRRIITNLERMDRMRNDRT